MTGARSGVGARGGRRGGHRATSRSAACARSPSCRPSSTGSSSPRSPCPRSSCWPCSWQADGRRLAAARRRCSRTPPTVDVSAPGHPGPSRSTSACAARSTARPSTGRRRWAPGPHTVAAGTALNFPAGAAVPVVAGADPDAAGVVRAAARGRRRARAVRDVLADPGDLPGHHGPAARAGALLHQPGRPGGPPDDAGGARPARRLLPASRRCYGCSARVYAPQLLVTGRDRRGGAAAARGGARRAGSASCSARSSPPARSRRSCRPRPGCCSRWPACCPPTCCRPQARSATSGSPRVVAGVVPIVLALRVAAWTSRWSVGLAFAVAASTFCPLLVLGIWWRGLTDRGAAAGHARRRRRCAGAASCSTRRSGRAAGGWLGALLAPAGARGRCRWRSSSWSSVSLATRRRMPADVGRTMLRLHAPERLGSATRGWRGPA